MSVLNDEKFDGAIANGAIPLNWARSQAAIGVSTVNPNSPPRALAQAVASANNSLAAYNLIDTNSGNVQMSGDFRFESTSGILEQDGLVLVRMDSIVSNAASYFLNLGRGTSAGVGLFKVVAGVTTQLGSTIGAASLADGIYYRATLKANGTSLSAYMVRLSDNRVMDNTGAWQSLIQPCITATDAAVAGAGYAGIGTYVQPGSSATVRVDNALQETYSGQFTAIPFFRCFRAGLDGGISRVATRTARA